MCKNYIGQNFDYLKVIEQYNKNQYICQCICGNKIIINKEDLLNKKNKKSCGCQVTKKELPTLYILWKRFSQEEKANWGTWENFVSWSKQKGFCEAFSYKKINRKLPYNKENLEFGLFINKELISIELLKKVKYTYSEREKKFVTSKRIKNLTISEDEITKSFNKQKEKHKILSKKLFTKLKEDISKNE